MWAGWVVGHRGGIRSVGGGGGGGGGGRVESWAYMVDDGSEGWAGKDKTQKNGTYNKTKTDSCTVANPKGC